MEFLLKAYDFGVRNMEMEANMFGAFTHHLKIKCACICVACVNRLDGGDNSKSLVTKEQWA